jgi:alpha-amylase
MQPRRYSAISIRMFTGLLAFLFWTIILAVPAFSANATDWSTRSIYQVTRRRPHTDTRLTRGFQVITDRFATSDDSTLPCDTGARKYCGGCWSGITRHLDYIQSMGFDAVWISPVSANLEGATSQGEAFHGCVVSAGCLDANSLSFLQVLG